MKKIKPVPNRHKPQGLTILYEDLDIIVIDKSSGLLTVRANYEKQKTASYDFNQLYTKGQYHIKETSFCRTPTGSRNFGSSSVCQNF